jgi:hypothetical protein
LFNINGFGQDEICANAKCFSNPGLTLHNGYGKRRLVGRRITRAFEQQSGVLLVIAVHDQRVEVFTHQLLHCSKWLNAGLDAELQIAQDLRHSASGFFIGTEEESLVTHTSSS